MKLAFTSKGWTNIGMKTFSECHVTLMNKGYRKLACDFRVSLYSKNGELATISLDHENRGYKIEYLN